MLQLHRFCSFSLLLFFVGFCAPDAAWCADNPLHEAQEKLAQCTQTRNEARQKLDAAAAFYRAAVSSEQQANKKVSQLTHEVRQKETEWEAQCARLSAEQKRTVQCSLNAQRTQRDAAKKAREKAHAYRAEMQNKHDAAINAFNTAQQAENEAKACLSSAIQRKIPCKK